MTETRESDNNNVPASFSAGEVSADIDSSTADAVSLFRVYLKGADGQEQDYKKADFWLKRVEGYSSDEDTAQRYLAILQDALDEKDYAVLVKWLENAAKQGLEIAKAMLDCHYKKGKDLGKRFREEGKAHIEKARKAAESGDEEAARQEMMKSLISYLPAIESIYTREQANGLKEKYARRDFDRLNLTQRELQILTLLLKGTAPKEIAYRLSISYATVIFHTNNLYRKLAIQSRAELFAKFKK